MGSEDIVSYSYEDILNFDIPDEQIIYVVISKESLSLPMDKLCRLVELRKNIICEDYESLCFLNELIQKKSKSCVFLKDDGKLIGREYIDLTKFDKFRVYIPLNYLGWGVKFNNKIYMYPFLGENNTIGCWFNGNDFLKAEDLKKIRDAFERLSTYGAMTDEEKVYLISDYIQSRTQYVNSILTWDSKGTFITPFAFFQTGYIETVFNHGYGLCCAIAGLSNILLNNDAMMVEAESVGSRTHAWNKVLIDGQYYYFDNTWAITRTDTLCDKALITLDFCDNYLLFGEDKAEDIGGHVYNSATVYNNGSVSKTDCKRLQYVRQFDYMQKPRTASWRI